jgi:uncharacterized membrane protein YphA (DoxX/SURF4 family)
MKIMQPDLPDKTFPVPAPRWKTLSGAGSALALSLLFLVSGIWKLTDLHATSERMVQSLVPVALSLPAAVAVSVAETFAGLLLLIPRYRRWGAWIAAAMLAAFLIYIGLFYRRLLGDDCNCFPWISRVIGPGFIAGDLVMFGLAIVTSRWSARPGGLRGPVMLLCGLLCMAGLSYGLSQLRRAGITSPALIQVDGKPFRLHGGRALLYFFEPDCSHCYEVAEAMARHNWGATRVIVLPTSQPEFAGIFLKDTGLQAGICYEAPRLRDVYSFSDPPFAVALDEGRLVETFNSGQLEGERFYRALRRAGFIR